MDLRWWQVERPEFGGKRYTAANSGAPATPSPAPHGGNSGAGAIYLAWWLGAARVGLLGYDCQVTNGLKHWHGDHDGRHNGNAGTMPEWPKQFAKVAHSLSDIDVINCSRETALECFPRMTLEAFINAD